MARRGFVSFHYQDAWRVNQVRNSWVAQKGETNRFLDSADWERVQRKGEAAIKDWIVSQLNGTGVTVVLIGKETAQRKYLRYEIEESHRRGNGLLGIYINRIKDSKGCISAKGPNPLTRVKVKMIPSGRISEILLGDETKLLSELYRTYDWVKDEGRQNIGEWIEEAARRAGR